MPTVPPTKIAQALNLTEQRVHQLVKEGLPKEGRGRFDPVKCLLWYVRYLQKALERKSLPALDGGYAGEREERVRLLRADADLREIQLGKERGNLVTIDDVEKDFVDLILTTKARVMGIPGRVSAELVGETSRVMIYAKLEKVCKESLAYLAERPSRWHPRANPPKREGQAR